MVVLGVKCWHDGLRSCTGDYTMWANLACLAAMSSLLLLAGLWINMETKGRHRKGNRRKKD